MEPVKLYQCPRCKHYHRQKESAIKCCGIEEFDKYVCPTCGKPWDDEEFAEECCDIAVLKRELAEYEEAVKVGNDIRVKAMKAKIANLEQLQDRLIN
jgi:transposase-like protein